MAAWESEWVDDRYVGGWIGRRVDGCVAEWVSGRWSESVDEFSVPNFFSVVRRCASVISLASLSFQPCADIKLALFCRCAASRSRPRVALHNLVCWGGGWVCAWVCGWVGG